jgi:hypothetical protein
VTTIKFNDDDLFELIRDVFGDIERDKRKQRLYIELCKMILRSKMQNLTSIQFDIPEQDQKSDSFNKLQLFVRMFKYLYNNIAEGYMFSRELCKKISALVEQQL